VSANLRQFKEKSLNTSSNYRRFPPEALRSDPIQFPSANGQQLAARLDRPPGTARAYALFAHCFTCSKDSLAAAHISRSLAAQGIAVLRFDFTGLGGSAGDFANANFSSNIADLLAAADFLRQKYGPPRILIGHSLGGAAVLAAASHVPEAVAVATVSAPYRPDHIRRLLAPAIAEIEARGEAEVQLAGRTFLIKRQLLDDLANHNTSAAIAELGKALLVFHSALDTTVDIDNATQIFLAAKHPKSFVSLDRADHLLTRKADSAYVADVLTAWAGRYLVDTAAASDHELIAEPRTVAVQETREGKFAQLIQLGQHVLRADEPVDQGGNDSGPSPYDLLLASLGACTSMTVRLYADKKKIPLEKITVRLRHEKIHAKDCAECETREGRIDKIEREIELVGPLDDAQRASLLEISNKCPVHRTLHSEVYIPTALKP
jgi:putative redox protein